MFPFTEIFLSVLQSLPLLVLHPGLSWAFWLVLLLVSFQYRRVARLEESLYGVVINSPWRQTFRSLGYGLVGGVAASMVLIFVGVDLGESGIVYLLPLALLLMLFNPRFLCFSYPGMIVSVSHLLFGWPNVNVAAVMALVAILHLAESILISLSGTDSATPIYVRDEEHGVVGAYTLQKFWPVPLVVLTVVAVQQMPPEGLIQMPDWWPLIPSLLSEKSDDLLYLMQPAMAALGYSELTRGVDLTRRSRATAARLMLYSVILLALSLLAGRIYIFRWAAALFGAFGHELVIHFSRREDSGSQPTFTPREDGLPILAVLPGSAARRAGLVPGDLLVALDGHPISSPADLLAAFSAGTGPATVMVVTRSRPRLVSLPRERVGKVPLGIVPSPDQDSSRFVEARRPRLLERLLERIKGRS